MATDSTISPPGHKILELNEAHVVVWSWPVKGIGTIRQILILDDLDTALPHSDVRGVLAPLNQHTLAEGVSSPSARSGCTR